MLRSLVGSEMCIRDSVSVDQFESTLAGRFLPSFTSNLRGPIRYCTLFRDNVSHIMFAHMQTSTNVLQTLDGKQNLNVSCGHLAFTSSPTEPITEFSLQKISFKTSNSTINTSPSAQQALTSKTASPNVPSALYPNGHEQPYFMPVYNGRKSLPTSGLSQSSTLSMFGIIHPRKRMYVHYPVSPNTQHHPYIIFTHLDALSTCLSLIHI